MHIDERGGVTRGVQVMTMGPVDQISLEADIASDLSKEADWLHGLHGC